MPTFAELGKDLTSGEVHRRYPDHVKAKNFALDQARLEKLCGLDVGGDVRLDRFKLEHAEAAMRLLDSMTETRKVKKPATRRA